MFDNLQVKGVVNLKKISGGEVVQDITVSNLVVDSGKSWIASMVAGGTVTLRSMSLGTGTAAAASSDTALVSSIAGAEETPTVATSANAITFTSNFTGVTAAVTEAGITNDTILLCRTVFAAINLTADDTLSITWTITIG